MRTAFWLTVALGALLTALSGCVCWKCVQIQPPPSAPGPTLPRIEGGRAQAMSPADAAFIERGRSDLSEMRREGPCFATPSSF